MALYKYRASSESGKIQEGYFEASSVADVVSMLKSNNFYPISIEEDDGVDVDKEVFIKRVTKKDMAVFCRQFYTMLEAGINIVNCLDILEKQAGNKSLKKVISTVKEDVQKGITLSEAMGKHGKIFSSLLTNMVMAGEVSGNLDVLMERMALHYERENAIENKVRNALVYPTVLSMVAIAVVIFLLTVVMPTFVSMFEAAGIALPGPTRALLTMSNCLLNYWYIFIGIFIGLIIGIYTFSKTDKGRLFLDNIKIKMPGIKKINMNIIASRFARTISTLLSSGMPLLQALDVVSKVVGNQLVAKKLNKATEDIRKGIPLSRTIKDIEVFPPMIDAMIIVGEESGTLDHMLNKAADFYDEEVETSLQKMTTLLEPILIILMAVIIGFIVISMAMPMFDVINTIEM